MKLSEKKKKCLKELWMLRMALVSVGLVVRDSRTRQEGEPDVTRRKLGGRR